jgi:DNA-binding response OmpR family regulator
MAAPTAFNPAAIQPRVLVSTHGSSADLGAVSHYLQERSCMVVRCDSAREAAEQAAVLLPHLVVVAGSSLPDLLDSCRAIRAMTSACIMVLGNQDGESDEVLCLESGSDRYLAMCSSSRRIVAHLTALLRRAVGTPLRTPAPLLRFSDISVDTQRRRVYRGENRLELSQKEYGLLLFLIEHAGQTVTRRALAQFVWGAEASSESRSLDVHIHWLRQKVEHSARYPRHIRTIRGVGYCFELHLDKDHANSGFEREMQP